MDFSVYETAHAVISSLKVTLYIESGPTEAEASAGLTDVVPVPPGTAPSAKTSVSVPKKSGEPETYSSLTAMILNKPLRETEDVDVKEEEGTEEIPEVVINIPSRPTIISIEGEVITPSVPEIEVGDITLPPVPEAPVLTYDYSTPKTAVLTVKDQVLTGEVIPTRPHISVVRSEMGVPSRPDILSITYESNLVPPTVRVFEVEKKTLTE